MSRYLTSKNLKSHPPKLTRKVLIDNIRTSINNLCFDERGLSRIQ